jgi:hypothetical protein
VSAADNVADDTGPQMGDTVRVESVVTKISADGLVYFANNWFRADEVTVTQRAARPVHNGDAVRVIGVGATGAYIGRDTDDSRYHVIRETLGSLRIYPYGAITHHDGTRIDWDRS